MAREQIFFHRSGNRLLLYTVGALGSTKGCLSLNPRSVGRVEEGWYDGQRKEKKKKKKREEIAAVAVVWERWRTWEWLLKETERETTIRKKGKTDVNSDVNGVALAVKGKREENRDKCEDYEGKNEREIRRLDNERENEKRVKR